MRYNEIKIELYDIILYHMYYIPTQIIGAYRYSLIAMNITFILAKKLKPEWKSSTLKGMWIF